MAYQPLKALSRLIDKVLEEITVKDDATYEYLRRQAIMQDVEPPESFIIESEVERRRSNNPSDNGTS